MIFRQLFEQVSGTYSYILASRRGGEALIIDPVLEKVDRYLQLMQELEINLVKALDTHLHHDHITGIGALRDRTHCTTVMGEQSNVDVVSMRVADGDQVEIEGLALDVIYTPGHTDDWVCRKSHRRNSQPRASSGLDHVRDRSTTLCEDVLCRHRPLDR